MVFRDDRYGTGSPFDAQGFMKEDLAALAASAMSPGERLATAIAGAVPWDAATQAARSWQGDVGMHGMHGLHADLANASAGMLTGSQGATSAARAAMDDARLLTERYSSASLGVGAYAPDSALSKRSWEVTDLTDPFTDAWASVSSWGELLSTKSIHSEIAWVRKEYGIGDPITASSQAAGWERAGAAGMPSLIDEMIAKARDHLHPMASPAYHDFIALTQGRANAAAETQRAVAGRWRHMEMDPATFMSRSTREAIEEACLYGQALAKQAQERFEAFGVTDTVRWMLDASPNAQAFDTGFLGQSIAAAALVEASRYDPVALSAMRGRSFLVDAFAEVDGFLADETEDDESETDDELRVPSLLERVFLTFQGHLAKARTPHERQALLNILGFVVSVAGLALSFYQSQDSSVEQAIERQTATINTQWERTARILEDVSQKLATPQKAMKAERKADRYVVLRAVPLKDLRSMKSRTLATLHPNQVVLLLRRDQNWIEVEYFDHLAGETRTGWLVKKYLRLMEH